MTTPGLCGTGLLKQRYLLAGATRLTIITTPQSGPISEDFTLQLWPRQAGARRHLSCWSGSPLQIALAIGASMNGCTARPVTREVPQPRRGTPAHSYWRLITLEKDFASRSTRRRGAGVRQKPATGWTACSARRIARPPSCRIKPHGWRFHPSMEKRPIGRVPQSLRSPAQRFPSPVISLPIPIDIAHDACDQMTFSMRSAAA